MGDEDIGGSGPFRAENKSFFRPPRLSGNLVDPVDAHGTANKQPGLAVDYPARVIGEEFEIRKHDPTIEKVGVAVVAPDAEVFDVEPGKTVIEVFGIFGFPVRVTLFAVADVDHDGVSDGAVVQDGEKQVDVSVMVSEQICGDHVGI